MKAFSLRSGVKQGCPFLFNIVYEVLAAAIREASCARWGSEPPDPSQRPSDGHLPKRYLWHLDSAGLCHCSLSGFKNTWNQQQKPEAKSGALGEPGLHAEIGLALEGHVDRRAMEHFDLFCAQCAKLLQSCPTLCNPTDCSLPGFSVPGILQVRILEWVAMPSSRGSS